MNVVWNYKDRILGNIAKSIDIQFVILPRPIMCTESDAWYSQGVIQEEILVQALAWQVFFMPYKNPSEHSPEKLQAACLGQLS